MKRHTTTALVLAGMLFGTALGQVALAKTVKSFRISGWSGGASFDEQTKQFAHCSASLLGSHGTAISYSVNDQYAWTLSLTNSTWNFSPGFNVDIALRINNLSLVNQRAVFTSNQTLRVIVDDSISLFEMLQVGRTLEVQVRGINLSFDLSSGDEALIALVNCVDQQTGRSKHSKSGIRNASRAAAAKSPVARDPAIIAEATAIATQATSRAQIPNSQVLNPKDMPSGSQGDAAWKADTIIGTVEIVQPTNAAKLEDVALKIVDQDSANCQGKLFAATAREQLDQLGAMRVFTSCRATDAPAVKYYLCLPRERGGHYVFGTTQRGPDSVFLKQRPAIEIESRIKSVIVHVLSNFKTASGQNPE